MEKTKELVDEITLSCRCGGKFSVREGSTLDRENPNDALDKQGWVKDGATFTCPHCGRRTVWFGNEPGKK